jgi:hypothetical protein
MAIIQGGYRTSQSNEDRTQLLVLLSVFLAAWLLGWVFHAGTGPVQALLLVTAVFAVARLPWRRAR